MRPFRPYDPHQIHYRVRLLVAGMLIERKGLCRDSEHCQGTENDQSGMRDRWGAEKTVGQRGRDWGIQSSIWLK